jgi:polyisoprenoid-binding protein YceI
MKKQSLPKAALLSVAVLLASISSGVTAQTANAAEYTIDPVHSSVEFSIRHIVSKVKGHFKTFAGTIQYTAGKPADWKANVTIDVKSLDTGNEKRDGHLKSPDFFDAEKFGEMKFVTTSVTDFKKDKAKIHGDLTLHGVTKPVVLDAVISEEGTDMEGKKKQGFSATTTIKRTDFGMSWGSMPGKAMLGDDVMISLEIEAERKK